MEGGTLIAGVDVVYMPAGMSLKISYGRAQILTSMKVAIDQMM